MRKITKITILLFIFFMIFIAILYIYKTQKMAKIFSREKIDNSSLMIIDNLILDRNLYPEGKIRVSASIAYVDRNNESIKLENCSINYEKNKKQLYLEAQICQYIEDKSVILKNNLKGKIDDLIFFSEKNGELVFFINDGYGSIKNGVKIIKDNNSISANIVDIYKSSKELHFYGNVRARYEK